MTSYCPPQSYPLHVLDDLLASLAPSGAATNDSEVRDENDESSPNNRCIANAMATDAAMAEDNRDLVLRAACDLFGNNISLLENALALLDEQRQYHNSRSNRSDIDNDQSTPMTALVIRKIRARRSGRTAFLVRKQRRKLSSGDSSKSGGNAQSKGNKNDHHGEKQKVLDEYYLCLVGKHQIDRGALLPNRHGWAATYRQGAHCTCRSFFQNIIKGEAKSQSACSNVVVCKHLLAVILMPYLLPCSKTGGVEDEAVDDQEFARLVMRASIG